MSRSDTTVTIVGGPFDGEEFRVSRSADHLVVVDPGAPVAYDGAPPSPTAPAPTILRLGIYVTARGRRAYWPGTPPRFGE